jgi:hypothetical protein
MSATKISISERFTMTEDGRTSRRIDIVMDTYGAIVNLSLEQADELATEFRRIVDAAKAGSQRAADRRLVLAPPPPKPPAPPPPPSPPPKRRLNISDEERQRRSERARRMLADRRARQREAEPTA